MKTIIGMLAAAALSACTVSGLTRSGLDPERFEYEEGDKKTALYTLTNDSGMEVCVTNFGGRIVSVMVPDKNGTMTDVVLGFDNINDYMTVTSDFGAAIGRFANRIGNARFSLDGIEYILDANDGENCLHGGSEGWQYRIYDAVQPNQSSIILKLRSTDGEMGFPGNVDVTVTYSLTEDNAIDMVFSGTTDSPTVLAMTSHSYFNLCGVHDKDGTGQILYINSDSFTPIDGNMIPTGEISSVEGTPMDFRIPKAINKDIDKDFEQIRKAKGYDHNWVLDTKGDVNVVAASLYSPATGILLECFTDQPGIQIYTGNFLNGSFAGKHGDVYPYRASVCLETQLFPDAPNKPEWASAVLRPGETYHHRCIYRFSVHEQPLS